MANFEHFLQTVKIEQLTVETNLNFPVINQYISQFISGVARSGVTRGGLPGVTPLEQNKFRNEKQPQM